MNMARDTVVPRNHMKTLTLFVCFFSHLSGTRSGHLSTQRKTATMMSIVGGSRVIPGSWPFIVGLTKRSGFQFCGGSLVAPSVVLTAAHCVDDEMEGPLFVQIGRHDLSDDNEEFERFEVEKIMIHPEWHNRDFALLKLSGSSKYTLVTLNEDDNTPSDGAVLTTMGWGATSFDGPSSSILLEVDIDFVNNKICAEKYKDEAEVTDQMMCAAREGKDACQGDSGGPLVMADDPYRQVGVVSWGIDCASPEFPGVYARVSTAISWIQETINALTAPVNGFLSPMWPHCRDLVTGGQEDSITIGAVCTDIVGNNVEIQIEMTGHAVEQGCCLQETHLCNYPMERTWNLSSACTRDTSYSFEMSAMQDFVCQHDDDTFQLDGHATIVCDSPLIAKTENFPDSKDGDFEGQEHLYAAVYGIGFQCMLCQVQNPNWLGDGWCDTNSNYNTAACGYDGGDCCHESCIDGEEHSCGSAPYLCRNPILEVCDAKRMNWIGDGYCDKQDLIYNNAACGYDGGDCCEETCVDGSLNQCGSNDYDCLDPAI